MKWAIKQVTYYYRLYTYIRRRAHERVILTHDTAYFYIQHLTYALRVKIAGHRHSDLTLTLDYSIGGSQKSGAGKNGAEKNVAQKSKQIISYINTRSLIMGHPP